MADGDPAPDPQRQGQKLLKKQHWRDKLLRKDGRSHRDDASSTQDDAVEDFLAPSKKTSSSPPQNVPRTAPPIAPRIDVSISQRWPASHDLPQNADHNNLHATLPQRGRSESPPRRRRPRRPGLSVKFAHSPPEIIGEGGDESEIPPQNISFARARSHSPQLESSQARPETARTRQATDGGEEDDFLPKVLVRAPTGIRGKLEDYEELPPAPTNAHQADYEMSMGLGLPNNQTTASLSPSSFAGHVEAKMRAEEGKALQIGLRDPSPEPGHARRSSESSVTDTAKAIPELNPFFQPGTYKYTPQPSPSAAVGAVPLKPSPSQPAATAALSPPSYVEQALELSATRAPSDEPPNMARDSPRAQPRSVRTIAHAVSDDALADFASRVEHFSSLFELAAESVKPIMETSLFEWTRAGIWWFLKGRNELEAMIRSRPRSADGANPTQTSTLQQPQALLNLAKAWWINQHIIPQHPEIRRYGNMGMSTLLAMVKNVGDHETASSIELHQALLTSLRALAISMKRNVILPPADGAALSQGLNTSVWIRYPNFAPDVARVLSGVKSDTMLASGSDSIAAVGEMMPLGDTASHFCYGRMFVDARISSENDLSQEYAMPCVLSIVREHFDWAVNVAITSQSRLVSVLIQADRRKGPTWQDVDWQIKSHVLRLKLPGGFELNVHFVERDFKTLWNIVEYTRKTEKNRREQSGESLIFETTLKVFHYIDPGTTKAFPPEPSNRCRLRLFQRTVTITEGTGTRSAHRGFRLHVVTSPKVKTLSSVSHVLGDGQPILFSYLRGDDGAPALLLKVTEDNRLRGMVLTFHDTKERADIHSRLIGVTLGPGEQEISPIPLQSFFVTPVAASSVSESLEALKSFQWETVRAINIDANAVEHDYGATVLSENLRLCVESGNGTFTDRINLGPGELQIGLSVKDENLIRVLRPPQQDVVISAAENTISKEMPDTLVKLLQLLASTVTIRAYSFPSLQELHVFEMALTGFQVVFDRVISSFAISRRRMVVPIHKKWEANGARLQVLQRDKIIQLVLFFEDFSHGQCMNFNVKSTDVFESITRSGKWGTRIVDAKFALPRGPDDDSRDFVCVDMPEYPGEHDDITILFETENDRDAFQSRLPSAVKESSSKLGTLKR